jgi:hypothetical protein
MGLIVLLSDRITSSCDILDCMKHISIDLGPLVNLTLINGSNYS